MPISDLRGGLFKSVAVGRNDIDIVHDSNRWQILAETAEPIGECRGVQAVTSASGKKVFVPCDGVMFSLPRPDYEQPEDPIWWQGAQCNACGAEVAIPNRRKLVRSSRHSEMPANYWTDRERRLRPAQA